MDIDVNALTKAATALGAAFAAITSFKTRKDTKPSNGKSTAKKLDEIADDVRFTKDELLKHVNDRNAHGRKN